MNFNEYQKKAMRTKGHLKELNQLLGCGALGLTGEVSDYIKKVLFQGHIFNPGTLVEELGDVMWYVALLCEAINMPMEYVAEFNISKLKKRYPNGFESEKSINREEL